MQQGSGVEARGAGNAAEGPVVARTGAGRSVSLGGIGVDFKVDGLLTGGALSIVEHPVRPGTLVPPHIHTREDELSYVLEGEFGVKIGDRVVTAARGEYVFKPRGVPHTFWNAGPGPAQLLEIIFPAGFERYFAEMAELLQAGGSPDFEQISVLASRYGLSFRLDWVPELAERYGLTLLGQ